MADKFSIEIPEPCHESWDKMTPSGYGRFCDKCCKTVVDFTRKTNEEIRHFFEARKGERVCGHYRSEQVTRTTAQQKSWFLARFACALYLAFGAFLFASCGETTIGAKRAACDTLPVTGDSSYVGDSQSAQAKIDSAVNADHIKHLQDSLHDDSLKREESVLGKKKMPH